MIMKVALFNDTGNFPHIGCLAVSNAHERMLTVLGAEIVFLSYVGEFQGLWKGNRLETRTALLNSTVASVIGSVDAVLVNGEGTIHHGAGLHLLAILDLAIELGKGTFLINAVLQDIPEYQDVFPRLNDLVVREARSANYARCLGATPRVVADSILEAHFDPGVDELYKGRIVVTDCHQSRQDVRQQLNIVTEVFENDIVSLPLEAQERLADWRTMLAKFRAARLVITGRHHGVYMALMAGTPFIALPSNTWKVESLLEMLDASNLLWNEGHSLISMVTNALRNPSVDTRVFKHDFLKLPLATLSGLREFSDRYKSTVVQRRHDRPESLS